jgi:hypothetical protein
MGAVVDACMGWLRGWLRDADAIKAKRDKRRNVRARTEGVSSREGRRRAD